MSFQYRGVNYSVINETTRTARVGLNTTETDKPTAVPKDYSKALFIPQFVYNENKKYEVVETGIRCCQRCTAITSISLPCSIIILRGGCFDECSSAKSFTFRKGSKLEVIEYCALARLYSIKTLVLPPTVRSIGSSGICCFKNLQALYICGIYQITSEVFFESDQYVMPQSVPIYVSRYYSYSTFSTRKVTISDFADKCFMQENTCNIKSTSVQHLFLLIFNHIFMIIH